MRNVFSRLWHWHGVIGHICTIFVIAVFVIGLIGLPLGITKCHYYNEVTYSNTFLNEELGLHNNCYIVIVNNAFSTDHITYINKNKQSTLKEGHFIGVSLSIVQLSKDTKDNHVIDNDDFKLKDHTGIHVPANQIAGLVGWDMIDYHWDQKKNGFVVSSADFKTEKAINDYSYIGLETDPEFQLDITVFFQISKNYYVENELMVIEVDFYRGGLLSTKRMGEDIILLPRPANMANLSNDEQKV